MLREQSPSSDDVDLQSVLDVLDDPASRTIIKTLSTPMTARELSDACDVPLSTTYRKLESLTETGLLVESTEVRSDGHHTTRYDVAFDSVTIALAEDRSFEVALELRASEPEERLAAMWSAVRREA
ncbi:Helix-turn-helix domain-containing protein [Halogranum rubrum]|uniref:Helix-turn-helix domain-containing protein n=2 Tax=Halogranum rubrum TaxID=553466 RepID=A0A1I4EV46_9EURY|nr:MULTISPECIES: helix-turn-helix domain-containing protein [Halogranum]EJN60196.1 iclr-like transcriptional regulator [Halogranum salarium B-1]SFL09578.1 Helix-turn-helix domain-containing protein [Halogranum rubrum]